MSIEEIINPIADLASTMENGKMSNLLTTMFHLGLISESNLQSLEDHYDYILNDIAKYDMDQESVKEILNKTNRTA